MIIDRISNAHLSPRIKRALGYLRRTDLESLSPGRHDIEGDRLYVMLSQYETKQKPQRNRSQSLLTTGFRLHLAHSVGTKNKLCE